MFSSVLVMEDLVNVMNKIRLHRTLVDWFIPDDKRQRLCVVSLNVDLTKVTVKMFLYLNDL